MNQLEKTSSFDVCKGETVSASQVLLELEETMEEVEEWRSRCRDAKATNLALTERLRELLRRHMSRSRSRSPPQPGRASEDAPSRLGSEFVNTGQEYSVLSSRQQRRKLSQLKTAVEKELWFMESFGLDLQSISVKTSQGKVIEIPMESTTTDVNDDSVRQTLHLLERFGVSDDFYHELSMANSSLPRSHLVKKSRQLLTGTVELERLPGPYCGAYRSFEATLKAALAHEV